jgi:hypothetical protein
MSKTSKSRKSRAAAARKAEKPQTQPRQNPVVESERPKTYEEYRSERMASYQPASDLEREVVDRIVNCHWQYERCMMLENWMLASEIEKARQLDPTLNGIGLEATAMRNIFTNHPRRLEKIHERMEHYLDLQLRAQSELQFLQAQRFNQGQGSQRFEVQLRCQRIM